jgi:hypothetical protein
MGVDRYYDENALPLAIFLNFHNEGISDALSHAEEIWNHLCSDHWSLTGGFFPYKTGEVYEKEVECEVGPFWEVIGQLYAKNNSLPNFVDYLQKDLGYKLLDEGWSSPLWLNYAVRHSVFESPYEERLKNTLLAFTALQTYYGCLTNTEKSSFVNLLDGSTKAWQGLLYDSYLCRYWETRQFKWSNYEDMVPTDDATAAGAMLMFLDGIVPNTGSLAIPLSDQYYEDGCTMFPATEFRFDHNTNSIRIPVWAGILNFIFGSETASYSFPKDGVYDVRFSSDWNTVIGATMISNLSENYVYVHPAHDVSIQDVAASKTVVRQGLNLPVSVTVANKGDFAETCSVTAYANTTAIGKQTTTSLPKGSSTTLTFTWNTTDFLYGNYTIRAVSDLVPEEANLTDDTCIASWTIVTVTGDVDGDFAVKLADLVILARAYSSKPGDQSWNPNADIDGNGLVGLSDLVILSRHY